MSADDALKAITTSHREVWTNKRYDLISEVYDEDFVGHFPGRPDWRGHADLEWNVEFIHGVFSDWTEDLQSAISDGVGGAASRWVSRGTHDGRPFLGIQPTGARVEVPEMGHYRFRDGRILEQWNTADHMIMYWQLGGDAVPLPD